MSGRTNTDRYALVAPLTFTGAASKGFTYAIPEEMAVAVGQVVKIPLGRQQSLGVVTALSSEKPKFATKAITEVLDLAPLPEPLTQLAEWMSAYYYASPKAVWQTLLPAGITRKRRASTKSPEAIALPAPTHQLTQEQQEALKRIQDGTGTSYLVQGVTGSGKTRLYMELVATQLELGKSGIILIPEIALTPQLLGLFEARFPGRVIAFHSGLTEAQKHVAWQRALEATEPLVVVGPRSSLFLPVHPLGVIVVDECHETSYKQEQNPRYHAVAVAAKLAHLSGAKLVLGSATPGLPEVYAAEMGRIELIKLTKRVADRPMPTAVIVDLRERELRGASGSIISKPLQAALTETLAAGRQSLLFINRRGSASSQICNDCGYVAMCPTCHLPLTFHADHLKLICHLCNYQRTPTAACPDCGHTDLRYLGGGTKRIESEIERLFPGARLARLDKDSADAKTLPEIYERLHRGDIDILIGTQMIAKGLDLPNLDTVGVVSADTMLHMPDFSSAERTFQLITQVAGRAGRGDTPGRVIIQTRTPDHPAIQFAAEGDFWGFVASELPQRQLLGYPPYRYLLKLMFSHKDEATAISQTQALYDTLMLNRGVMVLGPAPAFHARAGGSFHWQLVIKAARRSTLIAIAESLPATWKTDLDPLHIL